MATIFLSYTSDQGEAATRIELALKEEGHDVFRDRSSLPAGDRSTRIRNAVEECDLFVFLISQASISPGRYTLTELKFAEQKWGRPSGHILPVLVEPVPGDAIPAFLRAVTILNPQGNLTAELIAAVARMSASWWRRMLEPRRLVPMVVAVLVLVGGAGCAAVYPSAARKPGGRRRSAAKSERPSPGTMTTRGRLEQATCRSRVPPVPNRRNSWR
jgi:hypothetical protein